MFHLAVPLYVVLPSHEVPQEVTPIHEVHLIGDEETQVLGRSRQVTFFIYAAHPVLVGLGVPPRVHTREIHILLIQIFNVVAYDFVLLFSRISRRTINRFPLLLLRNQVFTYGLPIHFAAIRRTIEKWCVSILLAVQVATNGKNIAWCILTHRHIGIRPDEDDTITAIACQYHQHTGQRQFEHSPLHFIIGNDKCACHQDDIDNESCVVRTT